MSREWKIGDRFNRTITVSTDYEITRIDEKFVYLSDGKNIVIWPLFYLNDIMPLIPAAPDPQKLDTSKPMRISSELMEVRYLTTHPNGLIAAQTPDGLIKWYAPHDLENIPEPKRTTTQIVELVKFDFGPRIMQKSDGEFYVNVTSRAKVTYTEGEGWGIEEVES